MTTGFAAFLAFYAAGGLALLLGYLSPPTEQRQFLLLAVGLFVAGLLTPL